MPLPQLPPDAFAKQDASPDLDFYAPPRLVHHIDEVAVAALTGYYRELIPAHADVLDLMSSWVSHLPDDLPLGTIIGHGMNGEELAANPRLTRWFVQDLNVDPALPLGDASFDAALCCVGALRPGAPFAVSYSNRCFPTKAVAIWRSLDMAGQAKLIALYLERAGFAEVDTRVLADGCRGDPLVVVTGRTGHPGSGPG